MSRLLKKTILTLLLLGVSIALCFAVSNTVRITLRSAITRSGRNNNYTYKATISSISASGYDVYYVWTNNSSTPRDNQFQLCTLNTELSSTNRQYLWVRIKNSIGTFSTAAYFQYSQYSNTTYKDVTINDPDPPTTPTLTDCGVYSSNTNQHVLQIAATYGTLYYTTDGSSPTTSSTAYSSSTSSSLLVQGNTTSYTGILVSEGQTVKAVSYSNSEYSSVVSYTVPTIPTPPTPTIINHGVYASDATKRVVEISYSGNCDGIIYSVTSSTPSFGNGSAYNPSSYMTTGGTSYTGILVSEGSTITVVAYNRGGSSSSYIYKYSSYVSLSIRTSSTDQSGSVWYQHTTYDALNVFDLENAFYTPLRSVTWGNNTASTGTINESNYIGQLGVRNCSHEILFTVETDGRFVSRSDPSKYKEFWISMCPRYNYDGHDYGYYWDINTNSAVNSGDQAPNTRSTGSASIISPVTYSSNRTAVDVGNSNGSTLRRYITTFWIDLAMCMDELSAETLQHMEVNDDYYTTIILRWECFTNIQYGDCTAAHSGEYVITLRGYYGTSVEDQDAVSFIVEAEGSSQSLSIRSILNTPTKIATLNILSTNKSTNTGASSTGDGYPWADNVFAFLSSSSDSSTQPSGFVLTNVSEKNRGQTIPFVIQIYNQSDHSLNQTFDGTSYWTGKANARANPYCIDLSDSYTVTTDRYGKTYHALNYLGDVDILITDDGTIRDNANNAYSGRYESYIYYHIIYDPD